MTRGKVLQAFVRFLCLRGIALQKKLSHLCCQRKLRLALLLQLTKQDYDLPTLGKKLVDLAKNVSLGRGFQLITCADLVSQQLHHDLTAHAQKIFFNSKILDFKSLAGAFIKADSCLPN